MIEVPFNALYFNFQCILPSATAIICATATTATVIFARLFSPYDERDYPYDDKRYAYDNNDVYRFHTFPFLSAFLLYKTIAIVVIIATLAQMNDVHQNSPIVYTMVETR